MEKQVLNFHVLHGLTLRRVFLALIAVVVGTILGILVCELILAFFLPSPLRYFYPQPLHLRDPVLGWVMKPNQNSYTIDQPVITNSDGFRSPPIRKAKPPSGFRIICLGDSQTFGNGVAQDETYPAKLQARLSKQRVSVPVEVVNAGVQAYGIHQEVSLLERIAPLLQPDVVTIGFYLNDIFDVLRPSDTEIIDGEFKREGAIKQFIPYRLIYALKRSRLVTLLYWRYQIGESKFSEDAVKEILLGRTPVALEKSWNVIEDALSRAQRLAVRNHFRLIVFPVPAGQEFLVDYPNEEYRSRFTALAAKLKIDVFDPTPQMKFAGGGFERYFITWDGHINSFTHNLISELLFTKIESLSGPQIAQGGAVDRDTKAAIAHNPMAWRAMN